LRQGELGNREKRRDSLTGIPKRDTIVARTWLEKRELEKSTGYEQTDVRRGRELGRQWIQLNRRNYSCPAGSIY